MTALGDEVARKAWWQRRTRKTARRVDARKRLDEPIDDGRPRKPNVLARTKLPTIVEERERQPKRLVEVQEGDDAVDEDERKVHRENALC